MNNDHEEQVAPETPELDVEAEEEEDERQIPLGFPEVSEGPPELDETDRYNARVLTLEQWGFTLLITAGSIMAWGLYIWCMWQWFVGRALPYAESISYTVACGLGLLLLSLTRMGRTRPKWSHRPSWADSSEPLRRGMIIESVQVGIVRPLIYTAIGALIWWFGLMVESRFASYPF